VKLAAPGELVITEEAAAALPAGRWIVRALGPQQIRGVHHPVPIFAVSTPTRQRA
jgi:class 3 adenylate cyclase